MRKDGTTQHWHNTAQQFFKFSIIGALGFVIDYALLSFAINVLGFGRITAGLFSFPFSVTFTWFGNRIFTFSNAPPLPAHQQLVKFASVCTVGLILNRGTYSLLVSTVPFIYSYPVLGLLIGTAAGMFFNFFATKKHVFQS